MSHTGRATVLGITGLLLLVFATAQAQAQATASNFSFGQIDWYDEDGTLAVPDSSWGTFEFDLLTDPLAMYFLNVTADAGHGSAWIVENMPLFPDAVRGSRSGRFGADFDITLLGLSSGTDLASLGFDYTVTRGPLLAPPFGTLTTVPVQTVVRNSFGSRLEGPPLPGDVGAPFGIRTGFAAKAWAGWPVFIHHDNVPAVQEGTDMCLPGSLARSIKWLDNKYKLGIGKTAQQIYQDLAAFDKNPTRLSYEDFMAKKAKYLKDKSKQRGETKILDLTGIIGPVSGVNEETGKDVLVWLLKEFPTEDVELHYDQHIVTVTSVLKVGNKSYVGFRDDETQNNDNAGDTAEKLGELRKNADGSYSFRAGGTYHKVQALISESISIEVVVDTTTPWFPDEAVLKWESILTGETLSDIVFGDLGLLRESRGDFTLATVGCYANDYPGRDIPFLVTTPPGGGQWFLQRSTNVGGPGSWDSLGLGQQGERDPQLNENLISCPSCAHDLCVEGDPLDPACNWCVETVCAYAPWCCGEVWDEECIQEVQYSCGSLRCAASRGWCEHTLCSEGEPLLPGCDEAPPYSCVEHICLNYPECCTDEWHEGCTWAVESDCGMNCF